MTPAKSKTREAGPGSVEQLEMTTDGLRIAYSAVVSNACRVQLLTKHGGNYTKRIYRNGAGEVVRSAENCWLSRGAVETRELHDMAHLSALIRSLDKNQALCLSTSYYPDFMGVGIITDSAHQKNPAAGFIPRTADFFKFEPGIPALLLFDRDSADGERMTAARAEQILDEVLPGGVSGLALLSSHSTSSFVRDADGVEVFGEGNHHTYLIAADGGDIPRFREALEGRLWLAGYGRAFVSASGCFQPRTVFDMAVFSAERPVFEAGADLAPGWQQQRPEPYYREGCMLDTRTVLDLTEAEKSLVNQLKAECRRQATPSIAKAKAEYLIEQAPKLQARGLSEEDAMRVIERRQNLEIADEDLLYFDHLNGEPITAGEARKCPELHGKTLADPLEPDYGGAPGTIVKCKAKFYLEGGRATVKSFAHGEQWYSFPGAVTSVFAEMAAPDETPVQTPKTSQRYHFDLSRLKPVEFVIDGFIRNGLTVIAGAPGVGKTSLLVPLAAAVGHLYQCELTPVLRRKVAYFSEAPEQVEAVLYGLTKHGAGVRVEDFRDWFYLLNSQRVTPDKLAATIRKAVEVLTVEQNGYQVAPLIVLDTSNANIDLDNENDNAEVGKAIAAIKENLGNGACWLVHHTAKAQKRADVDDLTARGAGAFAGDANATAFVFQEESIPDKRFMKIDKHRFEARFHELEFTTSTAVEAVQTPWGEVQEVRYRVGIPARSETHQRINEREQRKAERDAEREFARTYEITKKIREVLTEHGPLQKTQIRERVGAKAETVGSAIESMLANLEIIDCGAGRGGGRLLGLNTALSYLPEPEARAA